MDTYHHYRSLQPRQFVFQNLSREQKNELRDSDQRVTKRLTKPTRKDEVKLIVQQLRQIRPNGRRQHAQALEHWFLGWRVPSSSRLQSRLDLPHYGFQKRLHVAAYCRRGMPDGDESYGS